MTQVFDAYAAYYDLLYRDKPYRDEAEYVDRLIRQTCPDAKDVLELGCGTGGHAFPLADLGYRVTGVDLSAAMVERARAHSLGRNKRDTEFMVGNLLDFRAGKTFDAVIALFHVVSYQTSNAALLAAMHTAAAHLRPGGAFIFDFWYGPGVLTDRPATRIRRLAGDGITAVRLAEPVMHANDNVVDVHYEILVEGKAGLQRIEEVHPMRYLFIPEIDLVLEAAGLHRTRLAAWMQDDAPEFDTWNACVVATP